MPTHTLFRTGLAGTGDQFLRGRIDGGAFSGDAHAGGSIDETPRIVRNDFQTVFGGIRRYQEDAVESVTVGGFDPLAGLVRNEIRGDETGSTGVFEITCESFDAVMEDEVPIAHDQWHLPRVRHWFPPL